MIEIWGSIPYRLLGVQNPPGAAAQTELTRDYGRLRVLRTPDVIQQFGVPIAIDDDDFLRVGQVVARGFKRFDGTCAMPFVIVSTWSERGRRKGGSFKLDDTCALIVVEKWNEPAQSPRRRAAVQPAGPGAIALVASLTPLAALPLKAAAAAAPFLQHMEGEWSGYGTSCVWTYGLGGSADELTKRCNSINYNRGYKFQPCNTSQCWTELTGYGHSNSWSTGAFGFAPWTLDTDGTDLHSTTRIPWNQGHAFAYGSSWFHYTSTNSLCPTSCYHSVLAGNEVDYLGSFVPTRSVSGDIAIGGGWSYEIVDHCDEIWGCY